MDRYDDHDNVLGRLAEAEFAMAAARRSAIKEGSRHYDSIALIQRELADLHDLIARDANKETGK